MGLCLQTESVVPVAPSTLGHGAQVQPPMRSVSTTRMSQATREVTLVDVKPGRCKFSGFTISKDEAGNDVRKQIGVADGYLKLQIQDVNPDEPNKPFARLYLRFALKEYKSILQIGPEGLEEKNSQTRVQARLVHQERANELSADGEVVLSEQCFVSELGGMFVLEDMVVVFDSPIKLRIEGSACWRPSKGTTEDAEADDVPVPKTQSERAEADH